MHTNKKSASHATLTITKCSCSIGESARLPHFKVAGAGLQTERKIVLLKNGLPNNMTVFGVENDLISSTVLVKVYKVTQKTMYTIIIIRLVTNLMQTAITV